MYDIYLISDGNKCYNIYKTIWNVDKLCSLIAIKSEAYVLVERTHPVDAAECFKRCVVYQVFPKAIKTKFKIYNVPKLLNTL